MGKVHSVTFLGGPGNDTLQVGDTVATSYLDGGPGDNILIHDGSGHVKMDGGVGGFNDCLAQGGDELVNCQY